MGKEFIDIFLFELAIECGNWIPRYFDNWLGKMSGGHWGYNGPYVAISRPLTIGGLSPFSVYSQIERMDGKPTVD
jgi:hypothetical protein